jgi:hypothetical protein
MSIDDPDDGAFVRFLADLEGGADPEPIVRHYGAEGALVGIGVTAADAPFDGHAPRLPDGADSREPGRQTPGPAATGAIERRRREVATAVVARVAADGPAP